MQDGNDVTDRPDLGPSRRTRPQARARRASTGCWRYLEFLHVTQRAIGIGDLAKGVNAPRSTTYTLVRSLVDAGSAGDGRRRQPGLFRQEALPLRNGLCPRQRPAPARPPGGRQSVARDRRDLRIVHAAKRPLHHRPFQPRHQAVPHQLGHRPADPAALDGIRAAASGRARKGRPSRTWCPKSDLLLPDGRRLQLDDFIADIATARTTGYCITSGLVDAYTKCLAAPVFSAAGKVEATMCLVVPIDTSKEKTDELTGAAACNARRGCRSRDDGSGSEASRSRNDVWNDLVFQRHQPVLEEQLLLLHALDLQRIAAHGDHRIDGRVEIGVLLLQPGKFEADISLFLFGHYLPSARLRRPTMGLIGRGRHLLPPARRPISHFTLSWNATTQHSTSMPDGGRVSWCRHRCEPAVDAPLTAAIEETMKGRTNHVSCIPS